MKLQSKKNKLNSSAPEEKHNFGIGDTSVIIEILRNRLYSNPIQTLTQEYLCNGRDSNREANNEKTPLVVTLPTKIESVLKIRDFGMGLSPERVKDVFVLYGASTKRGDNKQTGGFGIGAKSAWAYTDSFTVISYYKGKARTYVAHTGENSHGTLEMISEDPTKEKNGVEIQIPVEKKDIDTFKAAVYRATYFWPVRPKFEGITDVELPTWYTKSEPVVGGTGWGVYDIPSNWGINASNKNNQWDDEDDYEYENSDQFFVIDYIPYEVPELVTEVRSFMDILQYFNGGRFSVFFQTGELQVAASREAVVVEQQNLKQIEKRMKEINKDVVSSVRRELEQGKTIEETVEKMKSVKKVFTDRIYASLTFAKTIAGKKIDFSYKNSHGYFPMVKVEGITEATTTQLSSTYRSDKIKETRYQHLRGLDKAVYYQMKHNNERFLGNFIYVLDDETKPETAYKRIKSHVTRSNAGKSKELNITLLQVDNVEWFLKNLPETKKFSEVPKIVTNRKTGEGVVRSPERIIFNEHIDGNTVRRDPLEDALELKTKFIYLISKENGYWKNYITATRSRHQIDEIIEGFKEMGYTIYSFSEKHVEHFADGIEFTEALKNLKKLKVNKNFQERILSMVINEDRSSGQLIRSLPNVEGFKAHTKNIKNAKVRELINFCIDHEKGRSDCDSFLKMFKPEIKKAKAKWALMKKDLKQFEKKCLILSHVELDYYNRRSNTKLMEAVVDFINKAYVSK